jgi:hypothetical protein
MYSGQRDRMENAMRQVLGWWAVVLGKVPTGMITVTAAASRPAVLKTVAGDLVLKVQPGRGDEAYFYVLRKSKSDGWQVVAELADY